MSGYVNVVGRGGTFEVGVDFDTDDDVPAVVLHATDDPSDLDVYIDNRAELDNLIDALTQCRREWEEWAARQS